MAAACHPLREIRVIELKMKGQKLKKILSYRSEKKWDFHATNKFQVLVFFVGAVRASSVPIFPYLVRKFPIIPIIPSENKNILKFMNFRWWNVTKTVNFSDHPRPDW